MICGFDFWPMHLTLQCMRTFWRPPTSVTVQSH